jgi:hypothetical protein
MNAMIPMRRMPVRPYWSEIGPAISCPAASPTRQAVTVSCAIDVDAPRASVSAGSAGR